MTPTKALPREDRLMQIKQCFQTNIMAGGDGNLTVADIARMMRLAPSTKLRLMIEELVMDSQIKSTIEEIPGVAKFRRVYSVNHGEFECHKPLYRGQGRAIKINSKQQSLWAEVE